MSPEQTVNGEVLERLRKMVIRVRRDITTQLNPSSRQREAPRRFVVQGVSQKKYCRAFPTTLKSWFGSSWLFAVPKSKKWPEWTSFWYRGRHAWNPDQMYAQHPGRRVNVLSSRSNAGFTVSIPRVLFREILQLFSVWFALFLYINLFSLYLERALYIIIEG